MRVRGEGDSGGVEYPYIICIISQLRWIFPSLLFRNSKFEIKKRGDRKEREE